MRGFLFGIITGRRRLDGTRGLGLERETVARAAAVIVLLMEVGAVWKARGWKRDLSIFFFYHWERKVVKSDSSEDEIKTCTVSSRYALL